MTHDPLPSDIHLAERLLKDGRTDAEIAAALVRRCLKPARALQLLADLRAGRPLTPALPPELRPQTGSASPSAEAPGNAPDLAPPEPEREGKPHIDSAADGNETFIATWYILGVLLCLGAAVVFLAISNYRYHADTEGLLDDLEKAALEVTRNASPDPSKALPLDLSRPGAMPGATDSREICEYRSLLSQVATRRLAAAEQSRLSAITGKLDGIRRRHGPGD